MRWGKKGLIFDAKAYDLLYTKSPQAIVFKNYVRVYFSTCIPDGDKLISNVAYVDFDKSMSKVIKISRNVMKQGALGCFDEHGIFPFSPFNDGNKLLGYTSGWSRRQSVSVETAVGLAVSQDGGETFYRIGNGPVMAACLNEPFLVVDGFVRKFNGLYHMWYIWGTNWKCYDDNLIPERTYKIGHAVSKDGVNWDRESKQIIASNTNDECQALPSVIYSEGKYRMLFCYRRSYDFRVNKNNSYRLGYASSEDLITWERDSYDAMQLSETGWDSQMQCYPNVFTVGHNVFLLYNGNEFGKNGFGLAKLVEW